MRQTLRGRAAQKGPAFDEERCALPGMDGSYEIDAFA